MHNDLARCPNQAQRRRATCRDTRRPGHGAQCAHVQTVQMDDSMSGTERAPMWQRAAAQIIERIRSGQYVPGQRIPGHAALTEELGCAMSTVQKAIDHLVTEGYLHTVKKSGTYVAETLPSPSHDTAVTETPEGRLARLDAEVSGMRDELAGMRGELSALRTMVERLPASDAPG